MVERSMGKWVTAVVASGLLAGCGMLGAVRENAPQPPLPPKVATPLAPVKATGDTVIVDDRRSGSEVELRPDQQLIVRLRYDSTSSAQWELTDFVAGALGTPGPSRFDTPNGEAVLLGGEQIWRFRPAGPGRSALRFEYRPPHSRDPAWQTATFNVTVR